MRHREMLAHVGRILKTAYDTKAGIDRAYAGQLAGDIERQLLRSKGVTPAPTSKGKDCEY